MGAPAPKISIGHLLATVLAADDVTAFVAGRESAVERALQKQGYTQQQIDAIRSELARCRSAKL